MLSTFAALCLSFTPLSPAPSQTIEPELSFPEPIKDSAVYLASLSLPPYQCCKFCRDVATADLADIEACLRVATGWHKETLEEAAAVARFHHFVWMSACIIQGGDAQYQGHTKFDAPLCVQILRENLGERALLRGQLPLPLSCR